MFRSALIIACIFLTLGGCAPTKTGLKLLPLNTNIVNKIIKVIDTQDRLVKSFVSYGKIKIRNASSCFSADVMVAATMMPFRIKIEVTHYWGRPVCHILVQDDMGYILSFIEKKYYIQPVGMPEQSGLFPFPSGKASLWGILKGYPVLKRYSHVEITGDNRIAFADMHGRYTEILKPCMDNYFPCEVLFPKEHIRVVRSDFDRRNGIIFACSTDVFYQRENISWRIILKQILFNTDVPEGIFKLKVPSGYETVQE
jgi:hypothetical protein